MTSEFFCHDEVAKRNCVVGLLDNNNNLLQGAVVVVDG